MLNYKSNVQPKQTRLTHLIFNITNAISVDSKIAVRFWKIGRVVNLANSLLCFSFSKEQSSCRGMGHDVSSNGLLLHFWVEHRTSVYLGDHLIGNHHCDTELNIHKYRNVQK